MQNYSHLREKLAEQPIDLPVFNSVALELLHQLAEHDINYFEVIKTIKKDEALSIQVLRMSNSASYSGMVKCETIEKSAIRLGIQQIANLAIAASHASLHSSDNLVVNEIMQYLWQHSHACALGCRSIASMTGHQRFADHAYMAGLLHDIGKLYLVKAVEQVDNNNQLGFKLDRDVLHGVFSEFHVEFGCLIMDHWNIPDIYRSIVEHHHAATFDPNDFLLAIVRMVNYSSRKFNVSLYPTVQSKDEIESSITSVQNMEVNLPVLQAVMTGIAT